MSLRSIARSILSGQKRGNAAVSTKAPDSVSDYERFVADLIATHPLDEAMSLAVGGDYDKIGDIASDVVVHAGAKDGMAVLDFGCGSGRVASALSRKVNLSRYLGTDVVQALLDYAQTKTPAHYVFKRETGLRFPAEDQAFDMAYAFSIFTHLLQTECYIYLLDMHRVLKPGGLAVISFLELRAPLHWPIFETSAKRVKNGTAAHLDTFIERGQFNVLADHAGFNVFRYIDGFAEISSRGALGQSVAILRKR
ncbi:MAG: class I SAM-dependent methyltransferase [Rhizobiaceae bacterium]